MKFEQAWSLMLAGEKLRRPEFEDGQYWTVINGKLHETFCFNASGTVHTRTEPKDMLRIVDTNAEDWEVAGVTE